jgi:hypothetical protein
VQNLSFAALEELRMLSNITVDGRASLQTILLGQPQFRRILASPDLDQLRQRVLAAYHLGPLSEEETRDYILHRLRTVGWSGNPYFEDGAFSAVFRHTDGVPRRINTLSSRVLLYGALEGTSLITANIVDETANDLQRDLGAVTDATGAMPPAAVETDAAAQVLLPRIQALEAGAARQERIFRRLLDLLSSYLDPQRPGNARR